MINIMQWYLVMLLFSVITLPISIKLFKKYKDGGYIFSKTIGLAITGFTMWILSTLHILKFNIVNSYLCLLPLIIASFTIIIKDGSKKTTIKLIRKRIKAIIISEIAFLLVFLIGCHIKSYKPDVNDLEKFMDYGFMNIMDKTDYMPPKDMWFSGENINYYYMGQFFATFVNKLSGVDINYGYNLALITIFALAIISIFSITYNLLQQVKFKKKRNKYSMIGGIISTISVNIAGNIHYTVYGLIMPMWYKITGTIPNQEYYFWNSTRFIGYNPDTNDKTIHEFPFYSYVVGDLHAHVVNIIFVVTLLALLLSHLLISKKKKFGKLKVKNIIKPQIIAIGFLIGIFKMSNYWDFPIYTVVASLVFLFTNIKNYEKLKNAIIATIIQITAIILIPIIVSIPFMLQFEKISSAICLVKNSTPIWQLIILWGFPIITVLIFAIKTIVVKVKEKDITLTKIIKKISISDLFIIIIGISAIGLVLIPELVYVKDIYEPSQPRANTMFKLTFQSFIMFGICFGYIIIKFLFEKKKLLTNIIGIAITTIFLTTTLYPINAISYWFGNIFDFSKERTLNGEHFFEEGYNLRCQGETITLEDDYKTIEWIRENTDKNDVILEESGNDYEYSNQISTFTSRQTIVGWGAHEWLWRSVNSSTEIPEEVNKRIFDVFELYTSNEKNKIEELIKKYNISYIVIGVNERIRYNNSEINKELPCEIILKEIGNIVFETNVNNVKYPTYIFQVK